jgi:hypothetical protein
MSRLAAVSGGTRSLRYIMLLGIVVTIIGCVFRRAASSVDRLAGSQQQIAGTIAKLGTQKPASPPRPAPPPST